MVSLDILKEKGVPIDRQLFTWREMCGPPYAKLDDDAFTRIRVILMSSMEAAAVRFSHACAGANRGLQVPLARLRRIEHHQQSAITCMHPPDQAVLETAIAMEQAVVEVTASVAQVEPDPYLASIYRFGLIEDLDHLYRYTALLDRLEGKDADSILQGYVDILPGRPTAVAHRDPGDDVRRSYRRDTAAAVTKLNALVVLALEHHALDYYLTIGPMFADPLARALFAEIASIEEQHVTQYESLIDPDESWLEKWLLHEVAEVYGYWSCAESEEEPRIRRLWERFCDYELGHLHHVMQLIKDEERRDPAELLPETLPVPIRFRSHRAFVRKVITAETHLRARGPMIVAPDQESPETVAYRQQLANHGSPSEMVAAGYRYVRGTELHETTATEAGRHVDLSRTGPPAPAPAAGVFLDQLGARLAAERTSARLYQALLAKHDVTTLPDGAPIREEIEDIRDDELAHYALLERTIIALGGDPTALTPAADVQAVASMGVAQVLTDPRTSFTQALEAILLAELADNDGWTALCDLAELQGMQALAEELRLALDQEDRHLVLVRGWLRHALAGHAGAAPAPTGD